MLLGNYWHYTKSPLKFTGGAFLADLRCNYNTSGRNINGLGALDHKSSVPNGYLHPGGWILPQNSGGIAEYRNLDGNSIVIASLSANANISSSNISLGDIASAILSGPSPMSANIYGTSSCILISGTGIYGSMNATLSNYTPELSPENLSSAVWNTVLDGTLTAEQFIKIMAAVFAGKTTIVNHGGGLATVTFRNTDDSLDRVVVNMTGSERGNITYNID